MQAEKIKLYDSISSHRGELMGFAALWILLFHEWSAVFSGVPGSVERYITGTGFCGVDIFFFLSGMGMYHAMEKSPKAGRFYLRRFRRLFFPFVVMALVIGHSRGWDMAATVRALSGWSFWTENIYTLLWFVPAIAAIYAVYPWYHRAMAASGRPVLFTGIMLLLWAGAVAVLAGSKRTDLLGFIGRIPMAALGVLFACLGTRDELPERISAWLPLPALVLGGILSGLRLAGKLPFPVRELDWLPGNLLMAVSVCLLLPAVWRGYHSRVLSFLGGLSLEIYCLQEWMGGRFGPALKAALPTAAANAVLLGGIMAAAWVLHLLNERLWRLADRGGKKV